MTTTTLLVMLALGQVKAQPCRPTVACTAELVPAGNVEVELGVLGARPASAVNVLAKVSLLDWLQVQLGSDGFLVNQGGRFSAIDGAVGVLKARLLAQEGWRPTVSLAARAVLPTRPPLPAVQSTFDLGGTLFVSKDLGPLHVDLNASVLVASLQAVQGQGALAMGGSLSEVLGVELEVHSTVGSALPNDGGVRLVLQFSPAGPLVFDLGGDVGFFPQTRAWSLFAGVTFVPTAS